MRIRSTGFTKDGFIPSKYTCEGEDISPPLEWDEVPDGTRSLALVVDDPDAPDPAHPRRTFVHWVLYNIPPESKGLPEGANLAGLPEGALEGMNDFERAGWGGPCPGAGRHRYFFKLYALDITLPEAVVATPENHRPTKADLEIAMHQHVLESAHVVGTYKKRHTSRRAG